MPGLSYPFVYECTNCGEETTITRPEARDLAINPDSFDAVEIVLQQRGWLRDEINDLLWCSSCAEGELST